MLKESCLVGRLLNSSRNCWLLCNLNVHKGTHKIPSLDAILRLFITAHTNKPYFSKAHVSIIYQCQHTPWSSVPLGKLTEIPHFLRRRKFMTVFTRILYLSLSWGTSVQSTLPVLFLEDSSPIISSYLRLYNTKVDLQSTLLPWGFQTKLHFTLCNV